MELNENTEPNAPTDGGTWFESLPEDVRGNEAYASWKDKTPADLLAAISERDTKLSEAIVRPGDNATDEEKAAWAAKVREFNGVPEKIEDYKLDLPEEVPANDPVVQAMVKSAHESGLNPTQVKAQIMAGMQAILEHQEAQKLVNKESLQALWKDKFDENLNMAIKGLEGAASDAGLTKEEIKALSKALPSHAGLVRVMHVIGKYYSEDKFTPGSGYKAQEIERTPSGNPMLKYEDGFGKK